MLRIISRLVPLKHKLNFLIKKYLTTQNELAIRYHKNYFICITVNDSNRSTVEDVILRGTGGQPEAALIKRLRNELPDNMVLIDIGGNIGTFLWQFADKCDTIFVFEPIPRLNNVIKRSIEYNKDKKIKIIPKAVGDRPCFVKMPDDNNSNIVNADTYGDVLDIPVTTLDNEFAGINKIDLIKIDVEGYEVNVLNGAIKIIEMHRPAILVEVHPIYLENYDQHHTDVINFFEEHKYKIRYFSFLEELRMPRWKRIFSRWSGNKGVSFATKEEFLNDINKQPRLSSYHFYCEPA
jgi:FkbM family methyltransferase